MSDTSTTEATVVTVARGELTLVTVSEDYRDWPANPPEDRAFYATESTISGEYVILVVPDHDERSRGMWSLYSGDEYGLTLNEPHRGWNVERRYVRPYDAPTPPETPAPVGRPFTVGDRIVQSGPHHIANGQTDHEYHESPHGIGSTGVVTSLDTSYGADVAAYVQWDNGRSSVIATDSIRHADDAPTVADPAPVARPFAVGDRVEIHGWAGGEWDGPATVTDVDGRYVTVRPDAGTYAGVTGAFSRDYVRPLTIAGEDTITTAETFTQEDVDRLVREAREAAKREASQMLEDFKEAANARAVEYAEQNGLCSEFERCMEDIGLLGREDWHDRNDEEYRVTFTVSVTVQARDEEDAEDKARDELREALDYGSIRDSIIHHDTDVL